MNISGKIWTLNIICIHVYDEPNDSKALKNNNSLDVSSVTVLDLVTE